MKCPECGEHRVLVYGSASAQVRLSFDPDDLNGYDTEFAVDDVEYGDAVWDDDDRCQCRECSYQATVKEFEEG